MMYASSVRPLTWLCLRSGLLPTKRKRQSVVLPPPNRWRKWKQGLGRDMAIHWLATLWLATLSRPFQRVLPRAMLISHAAATSTAIFVLALCCPPSAMATTGFVSGYAIGGTTDSAGNVTFGKVTQ